MAGTPTTSMSRLVAKLLDVVIMWYASSRTVRVRPRCRATSGVGSASRLRAKGRPSTMLANLWQTCTGASAVSRPWKTSPYTPASTASLMVEAAWKKASAL